MNSQNRFGLNPLDAAIADIQKQNETYGLGLGGKGHSLPSSDYSPSALGIGGRIDTSNIKPISNKEAPSFDYSSANLAPPKDLVPVFEQAAIEYNVPVNILMAMAQQESSYNDRAVGVETKYGTAKGIMQNLDSTAKNLGIDPYNAEQSIKAAAKQIRERLDKGYEMVDAVREHFAGPDRRLWKEKTERYGHEVLAKAQRIRQQLYPDYDNNQQQEEPQVQQQDEPQMQQQAGMGLTSPEQADVSAQGIMPADGQEADVFGYVAPRKEKEVSVLGALGEALKTYSAQSVAALARSPEAALRVVEGTLDALDRVGEALDLPDWMLRREYVSPIDIIEPLVRGKKVGGFSFSANEFANDIEALGKQFEDEASAQALRVIQKKADAALKKALETGDVSEIADLLSDPTAWAVAFGAAAPSIAIALVGGMPAIIGLESGSAATEVMKHEKEKGKISDQAAANAIIQTVAINAVLEKVGLDAMLGRLPKNVKDKINGAVAEGVKGRIQRGLIGGAIGGIGETGTEILQELNQNLAKKVHYDPEQELSEGLLMAAMGGTSAGSSMGAVRGATFTPPQEATREEAAESPLSAAAQSGVVQAAKSALAKGDVVSISHNNGVVEGMLESEIINQDGSSIYRVIDSDGVMHVLHSTEDGATINGHRNINDGSTRLLASPVITVTPEGVAMDADQRAYIREVEQEQAQNRADLGITPDIERVYTDHRLRTEGVVEETPVLESVEPVFERPAPKEKKKKTTKAQEQAAKDQFTDIAEPAIDVKANEPEKTEIEALDERANALRERLSYIQNQASQNGWDKRSTKEKNEIQKELSDIAGRMIELSIAEDAGKPKGISKSEATGTRPYDVVGVDKADRIIDMQGFDEPDVPEFAYVDDVEPKQEPEKDDARQRQGKAVVEADPYRNKTNAGLMLNEEQVIKVKRAFGSMEVEALTIGVSQDGVLNFGETYPDGRFYIGSTEQVVGFDGKGSWEVVGEPDIKGKYDIKAEPSVEIIRVISSLGAKQKQLITETRSEGVTTFVIDPSVVESVERRAKPSTKDNGKSPDSKQFANNKIFTADAVKETPEWIKAKAEYDAAFAQERAANDFLVKNFGKEYRADREAEKAAKAENVKTLSASQEKAIARINAGRAWFGTKEKADDFISKHGLGDEYHAQQTGAKRFEVVVKPDDVVEADPYRNKTNAGLMLNEEQVIKVKRAFGSMEVEALTIGVSQDGVLNFGETYPDGRFYIGSTEQVVGFDGKGSWEVVGEPDIKGKYDIKAEPSVEIIRVISSLGAKQKQLITETRSEGVTTFVIDPSAASQTEASKTPLAGLPDGFVVPDGINLNDFQIEEIKQGGTGLSGEIAQSTLRSLAAMRDNPDLHNMEQAKTVPNWVDLGGGIKVRGYRFKGGVTQEIRVEPSGVVLARALDDDGTVYGEVEGTLDQLMSRSEMAKVYNKVAEFFQGKGGEKAVGKTDTPKLKAPKSEAVKLRQDWGVDLIDGDAVTDEFKGVPTDFGVKGGVKDAYLKDASNYLKSVFSYLEPLGYEPFSTAKPKSKRAKVSAVTVKAGGVGVSGDVNMRVMHPETGNGAFVSVTREGYSYAPPATSSILVRAISLDDPNGIKTGQNWLGQNLTSEQLADEVLKTIRTKEYFDEQRRSKSSAPRQPEAQGNIEQGGLDTQSGATPANTGGLEAGESRNVPEPKQAGDTGEDGVRATAGNVEPVRAEPKSRDAGDRRQRAGREGDTTDGAGSERARANQPADLVKKPESVSPANKNAGDFYISDPEQLLGGGQVARFNKNKDAIELRNKLIDESRAPTKEEQLVLGAYSGWGSFGQELFQGTWENPRPAKGWEERSQWLRDSIGKDEWEGLKNSIINSHYTDPPTVKAMWDMVEKMGFDGGRVLEPAMGVGNFYGLMPQNLTQRSQRAGIELDPLTGSIAKMLYPNANISIMGYQDSKTPDNFYDLVIGNWPFASFKVADRRYSKIEPELHDYFFLKALDQTRAGGLVVGITSTGTMDKKSTRTREALAKKAELVAAFRLPSGAFQSYAGTNVVTDIIVLKKRFEPISNIENEGWINSVETPVGERSATYNEYFVNNPQNVIGQIEVSRGLYNRESLVVKRPDDMQAALNAIVDAVPQGVYEADNRASHVAYLVNHTNDRTNSLVSSAKGEFHIVRGEHLVPSEEIAKFKVKDKAETDKRVDQLERLIDIKKKYADLIQGEQVGQGSTEARKSLKKAYDAFVKKHGPLSDSYGLKYMATISEPYYAALAALENRAADGSIVEAKILSEETTRGAISIDKPTVPEAYVISRNVSVNPSVKQIADLVGKPENQVKDELVKSGAVFELPNGDISPSDVYLSGNVRQKLKEARQALEQGNSAMERNIAELQKVIPEDIPYYQIETQFGAPWVPSSVYADYVAHMLGRNDSSDIKATYSSGSWRVDFPSAYGQGVAGTSGFGTPRYSFKRLVNAAISNQQVTIKAKDENKNEYVDHDATAEVNGKIAEMRSKFAEWLWSDPVRRVDLEQEYNEVRNAFATPTYDGSFMSMSGMALELGDSPFNLRSHQLNAIWRGLVKRKGIYAHEVGTGKTFTMAGIAIESRRYGIAKKPVIFAHNANSVTVANEISMMYPAAKVLYVGDLSKGKIEVELMRIANDDWDAIVLPHSLIDRLTFKEETLMEMAAEQIRELEQDAIDAASEDGVQLDASKLDDADFIKKLRSPTAKNIVNQRMKIIENIKKQAIKSSAANAVSFEDLGIDMILVDEFHEFKKPPFSTKMKMKGLQTEVSNRSISMMFMTDYVRKMNGGNNVHLFSGTPITNTMTEAFHMMRYVMREDMADLGVDQWDGWFGSFARETDDIELTSTGEYEPVTRLQSFINVPELRQIIGQYMDVVYAENMPEMQPRKVNGKTLSSKNLTEQERAEIMNGRTEGAADRPYKQVVNESADMTPEQNAIFEKVQGLAKKWREMTGKQKRDALRAGAEESPLIYDGIAERASFDTRLVDGIKNAGKEGTPEMEPHESSKPARAIKNLLDIYHSHPLAGQVVFMDIGISDTVTRSEGPVGDKKSVRYKSFSTMKDMIERLVQNGVPREEIAVVTADTKKQTKAEIAQKMNTGEIRIVFGSTGSLGVGVNMQRNLRAMHHLDAPWTPGDLEQRNGRGQRQGNQWNTVKEYRYLTDKLDGRRWQVLSIKKRFIDAFMKSDGRDRVIEGDAASDEQSDILSTFSDAAGDPRVLIREKLKKRIDGLKSRERLNNQAKADAVRNAKRLRDKIASDSERLARLRESGVVDAISNLIKSQQGDGFRAEILGQKFDSSAEAATFVRTSLAANMRVGQDKVIGKYGQYDLHSMWGQHDTEPMLYLNINGYELHSNGASLQSLANSIRTFRDNSESRIVETIEKDKDSASKLEEVAKQPFHMQEQLSAAEKQLADLETDISLNPVAPPYWLRSGAPIETSVYWNDNEFEVTGHRWTNDGWFVLAENETGTVVIPYMEAMDKQGMNVYEEVDFVAPDSNVVTKDGDEFTDDDRVDASFNVINNDTFIAITQDEVKSISPAIAKMIDSGLVVIHGEDSKHPMAKKPFIQGFTDSKGVINLVAKNISEETALPVFMHELFHSKARSIEKSPRWRNLLTRLDQMYAAARQRQAEGRVKNGDYWDKALGRVDEAIAKHPIDELRQAEEFGAYAIEEFQRAPAGIRKWVESIVGEVKNWFDARFGIQLGKVTPAQLRAFSKEALKSTKDINTSVDENIDVPDLSKVASPKDKAEALNDAMASISKQGKGGAKVIRDMFGFRGTFENYAIHPYTLATLYPEFTPVYKTAVSQHQMRNRIVEDLYKDFKPYLALKEESKAKVNKVLELGRLFSNSYPRSALESGIKNEGYVTDAQYDDDGTVRYVERKVNAKLTKEGEVVTLNQGEIDAYLSLRAMYDRALDRFKDQALVALGFEYLVGSDNILGELENLSNNPLHQINRTENIQTVKRVINDIEQAKRTGYIPFTRYGDYVIAVRERQHDIKYKDEGEFVRAHDVPTRFDDLIEDNGGLYDAKTDSWLISPELVDTIESENSQVIYSEKVETGLKDRFGRNSEGRVKREGRSLEDIPSVKEAIARINKEYVDGNPMRSIYEFDASKKSTEKRIDIQSMDALAELAMVDRNTYDQVRESFIEALKSQSFRSHFFKSRNVEGYSTDFERSTADYIVGLAGYISKQNHAEAWDSSIRNIKGDKLAKYAQDYQAAINNPVEEYATLRQFGFLMYIAGNISSAVLNATQVPIMTMPFFAGIVGHSRSLRMMANAYKDAIAMTGKDAKMDIFNFDRAPSDVREELERAKADGVLLPLNSLEIMGMANRKTAQSRSSQRKLDDATQLLAYPFTATERLNRLVTFIAALRMAKNPNNTKEIARLFRNNPMATTSGFLTRSGQIDPFAFAEFAVDETQFTMGKLNRPRIMRGVGAPIMQFKSFMTQFLETVFLRWPAAQGKRGKKASAQALLMMMLLAGAWGFPAADDMKDLIEATYKGITKKDLDLRDKARGFVYEATGGSEFLTRLFDTGVMSALPTEWDMSNRVGLGSILPQFDEVTGVKPIDTMLTTMGIPADLLVGRPIRFFRQMGRGDVGGALTQAAPNFVENVRRADEWRNKGVLTRDQRRILNPEDVSSWSVISKALGFQPTQISEIYMGMAAQNRSQKSLSELKRQITNDLVRAYGNLTRNTDPSKEEELLKDVESIFSRIAKHNESAKEADEIIKISNTTLRNRLREELGGRPASFGKEGKSATAAQQRREVYGLDRYLKD